MSEGAIDEGQDQMFGHRLDHWVEALFPAILAPVVIRKAPGWGIETSLSIRVAGSSSGCPRASASNLNGPGSTSGQVKAG